MRIVFIGSVLFSGSVLEELIALKAEIVGVCTLPSSSFNADFYDLSPICTAFNIPIHYTSSINDSEVISWIADHLPDVIFCFGWSQILKEPLLNLAPMGVVGFHPTALPNNRGRHPLIWALALGLSETASTFFFMDTGADSGDILSQHKIPILPSDNASSLYERVTTTALGQIREFLPQLISGNHPRNPQDHSLSNVWRKRHLPDGCIDFRMTAQSIFNLVRALSSPYFGAHFLYSGSTIKVWDCKPIPSGLINLEPGKVLCVDRLGILVKCGTDSILLTNISPSIDIKPGMYL